MNIFVETLKENHQDWNWTIIANNHQQDLVPFSENLSILRNLYHLMSSQERSDYIRHKIDIALLRVIRRQVVEL